MAYPTPKDAFALVIKTWEGEWSDHPNDSGNYVTLDDGTRRLVGTMRGVTASVFAAHRKISPESVTPAMMKKEVTLDLAASIFVDNYFRGGRMDRLPWSPFVEITADIAWGSGIGRAVRMMQETVGAHADGSIGPQTVEAVEGYLEATPIAEACDALADRRAAFYVAISQPGTKNAAFRKGWLNRANWARPSNSEWWSRWEGWTMPHPAGSSKPTGPSAF